MRIAREPIRAPMKLDSIRQPIPSRCATQHAAAKGLRVAPCRPRVGLWAKKGVSSLRRSSANSVERCTLQHCSQSPVSQKEQHMFTGCGTAMVTPFRQSGSLDEVCLRRLIQRQIDQGVDFLVPCGTTGESPTLSHAEHLRVVQIAVEMAEGNIPVLAGAGGYNTAEVIAMAREIASIGADGILSVTPYYNKPTQEGLYQHF